MAKMLLAINNHKNCFNHHPEPTFREGTIGLKDAKFVNYNCKSFTTLTHDEAFLCHVEDIQDKH